MFPNAGSINKLEIDTQLFLQQELKPVTTEEQKKLTDLQQQAAQWQQTQQWPQQWPQQQPQQQPQQPQPAQQQQWQASDYQQYQQPVPPGITSLLQYKF